MKTLQFIHALFWFAAVGLHPCASAQSAEARAKPEAFSALEIIKKSAQKTQDACMQFVQMNVFEFEECVNARLTKTRLPPAERLGIVYMGFVGALSAQRMGSQGSQQVAWSFGKQAQKVQKLLRITDQNLCATVPGDCDSRLARTKFLLNGPAPAPLTENELSGAHRH